jgi:hypothetical protein
MRRNIAFTIAAAFLILITAACDGAKSGLSKSASLFGYQEFTRSHHKPATLFPI